MAASRDAFQKVSRKPTDWFRARLSCTDLRAISAQEYAETAASRTSTDISISDALLRTSIRLNAARMSIAVGITTPRERQQEKLEKSWACLQRLNFRHSAA